MMGRASLLDRFSSVDLVFKTKQDLVPTAQDQKYAQYRIQYNLFRAYKQALSCQIVQKYLENGKMRATVLQLVQILSVEPDYRHKREHA